ncbi:MAG: Adenylosuccinate synthetase [Thermoproteota archaeon]|nr:Adenylosuccinate synthetase [Thermoproteota archaeon]
MPCTVLVGGFFGDEGKGKLFGYLVNKDDYQAVVRGQGPQAGHTIEYNNEKYVFRQIPTAVFNLKTQLLLSVGSFVSSKVLFEELERYKEFNVEKRLKIDENATVILDEHIEREKELVKSIGSVGTGTGIAFSDRVMRRPNILVKFVPELKKYSEGVNVSKIVNGYLDEEKKVGIEGAHGTFLSNFHGTYPYTNAYDDIAAALLSQTGVGPGRADNVILVFKSFVSRVGQGPLNGELSLEEAEKRGWTERGTVSGRLRRAAPFDVELARDSIRLNYPTDIALTKVDILYPDAYGVTDYSKLPEKCQRFIEKLEKSWKGKPPITLIGTGPGLDHVIDLRKEKGTL